MSDRELLREALWGKDDSHPVGYSVTNGVGEEDNLGREILICRWDVDGDLPLVFDDYDDSLPLDDYDY